MNTPRKFAAPAALAFGLLLSVGSAFAAPVFSTAAPGSGMNVADFQSQMEAFNATEVTDLVSAKTVSVIQYADAWTGDDSAKAADLPTNFSDQIALLRDALKKNPDAMKLLDENKIAVDSVVDIVSDGQGAVSLYIS